MTLNPFEKFLGGEEPEDSARALELWKQKVELMMERQAWVVRCYYLGLIKNGIPGSLIDKLIQDWHTAMVDATWGVQIIIGGEDSPGEDE